MSWKSRARSVAVLDVPSQRAVVYVAWGIEEDRPLYVGRSRTLMTRIGQHAHKSAWWPYVRRLEVYSYANEGEAIVAEAEAIADLRPEWNQRQRGGPNLRQRLRRKRWHPEPAEYGPPLTFDEISADQLAIIARVQNRGRVE